MYFCIPGMGIEVVVAPNLVGSLAVVISPWGEEGTTRLPPADNKVGRSLKAKTDAEQGQTGGTIGWQVISWRIEIEVYADKGG